MDDRGIRTFRRLSREQAEKLASVFDEGLLLRRPDIERMREITGTSFSDKDLTSLASLYLYLLMTKISDVARRDVESDAGLDPDEHSLLVSIAKKMRGAIDANKMTDNLLLNNIRRLGHPNIVRLDVYTEFRPLSENGKIKKVVPYLVVDGTVRTGRDATRQPIKFQINRAAARHLAENLQSAIDALEDEIADMRNKFGEDVVLD